MSSIMVFGGSRGIGSMVAEHLINSGHQVSVVSRNAESLDKFKKVIARKNLYAKVIVADIANARDVARAFKSHREKWLSDADVVINCAAIQGPIGNSWEVNATEWEETVKVNLLGSFFVARAAIKQMMKKGHGSIIMFSGGGAAYARPRFSAYGVSKTGILRMVETIAKELEQTGCLNIIINAVAPGAVKTRMTREVLKAGSKAGKKDFEEATQVLQTGGTSSTEITDLIDFLIDLEANCGLTGRLIHVREDYRSLIKDFGDNVPDDIGKIRRIPIRETR